MINGLHHISMKCADKDEFEKAISFYTELLGFKVIRRWPEGIMIDLGNTGLEIFNNGEGIKDTGAIRHLALACDDVDGAVKMVKDAGYVVFTGPKDIEIKSDPVFPARMAFCYGPLGEQIEFFQERSQLL